jgi:uncharacterized alpha/beta hydrolase family protein
MKKVIITIVVFAITALIIQSCTKAITCVQLATDVANTQSAFVADSSKCSAYKAALNAWLNNSTCANADSTSKAAYTTVKNSLPCQ